MCKKIIKKTFGLLIDCGIICCLPVILLFCKPTWGNYTVINVLIIYAIIITVSYIAFAWFNRWKTPGIKLMTEQSTSTVPKRKIALATFLDWFLIFSLMLIINLVLRQFIFIDTVVLFTIIAPLYYIISYLTFKQTFGYCFCGIELIPKQRTIKWTVTIIKRELLKFGLGAWLPLGILYMIFKELSILHILFLLLLNIIVLLLYYTSKEVKIKCKDIITL